jgi:hypothetical protein
MKKDDPGPHAGIPFSFPDSSPPPSLNQFGLGLFVRGPSVPGPLASPEIVEAYKRRREEEEADRREREEEEASNPPPASREPGPSLLDIVKDTFDAGRRAGREEGYQRIHALLAEDERSQETFEPSTAAKHSRGRMPSIAEHDDPLLIKYLNSGFSARDARRNLVNDLMTLGVEPGTAENRASKAMARLKLR